MTIKTAKVTGRRVLKFQAVDEILADAERLATGEIRCLGSWSAGQILKHLAITINNSVDGVDMQVPWFVRVMARLFKNHFLTAPMKPGFQMPKHMEPHFMPPLNVSVAEGLSALRLALDRYRTAPSLAPSPAFGKLTRDECDRLHQRHAEMHLSFLVPA